MGLGGFAKGFGSALAGGIQGFNQAELEKRSRMEKDRSFGLQQNQDARLQGEYDTKMIDRGAGQASAAVALDTYQAPEALDFTMPSLDATPGKAEKKAMPLTETTMEAPDGGGGGFSASSKSSSRSTAGSPKNATGFTAAAKKEAGKKPFGEDDVMGHANDKLKESRQIHQMMLDQVTQAQQAGQTPQQIDALKAALAKEYAPKRDAALEEAKKLHAVANAARVSDYASKMAIHVTQGQIDLARPYAEALGDDVENYVGMYQSDRKGKKSNGGGYWTLPNLKDGEGNPLVMDGQSIAALVDTKNSTPIQRMEAVYKLDQATRQGAQFDQQQSNAFAMRDIPDAVIKRADLVKQQEIAGGMDPATAQKNWIENVKSASGFDNTENKRAKLDATARGAQIKQAYAWFSDANLLSRNQNPAISKQMLAVIQGVDPASRATIEAELGTTPEAQAAARNVQIELAKTPTVLEPPPGLPGSKRGGFQPVEYPAGSAGSGAYPRPKTWQDAFTLPPGTKFLDGAGVLRITPPATAGGQ